MGWLAAIVIALLTSLPSTAFAQASLQVPLEFDFLNPGARSLAMGSAFVGLADDATAAFTNPAGLTALARPEISIEGRVRRLESPFLERGRLSGTLSNQGIDTIDGARYGVNTDTTFIPSFLSFMFPLRKRAALAFYRHEVTSVSEQFETQGVFQFDPHINSEIRETALQASRDLDITSYGAAVAFRLGSTVSIGGGLNLAKLSLDSTFRRFVTFPSDQQATHDPSMAVFEATQTADDFGTGASVGVHWTPRPTLQAGAVFRKAPEFAFQQALRDLPDGAPAVTAGTFRAPDVVAIGGAWRPRSAATVTFEYAFVRYSELKDDFVDVQAGPSGRQARFTIDDGNEFHVGWEYVAANLTMSPAFRAGYWFDPAHSVVYHPPAAGDVTDERFSAYLPGQSGLSHFTFGGGVSINPKLEINGGADLSSRRSFLSVFGVIRL